MYTGVIFMEFGQLETVIEERYEDYVSFLCDICSFEARADDVKTLNKMVDFIEAYATKEGFTVERCPMEKCADFLCIDMNKGAQKGGLMLAHMDTVHEKGVFGENPITRLEDRIIGPGVIDCKGGIAVALLAMKTLLQNGYPKHLRLLLTSDEEVSNVLGGEAELEFFKEKCEGFPCALNCELSENNRVVISRKGICKYRIDVKGISGHSGVHYFECRNPIEEAAHKIIALQSKSERGGITYSCNIINAGGNMVNVIPETCTVFVDVRFPLKSDLERIEDTMREIVGKSYVDKTSSTFTALTVRPPMERNEKTDELFEKIVGISRKYGLGEITPFESGGGSDSCYTQALGIPSICGMGAGGKFCHTTNEYVITRSVAQRAKLLSAFFMESM